MALNISTAQPTTLLNAIVEAIDNSKVKTWRHETFNGVLYLTHTAEQWSRKAWFRPLIYPGRLCFSIVKSQGANISTVIYAEYHGLLLRMLLADFDGWFTTAEASAMPALGDVIAA